MNNHERYYSSSKENNNLSGESLLNELKSQFGIDFVTGLPCGELKEFIAASSNDKDIEYVQATNEREAVGIAFGAWLGGKKPLLYMQNSGLFECSNDLGSLMIASHIPAVFLVSWRGAPGEEATQHLATGKATIPLLESFGLSYSLSPGMKDLQKLKEEQEQSKLPVAILMTREHFNDSQNYKTVNKIPRKKVEIDYDCSERISSREEALQLIATITPNDRALFSSTGLISRSLYHHFDSSNQFYNAGAFGLTSSIALGFSNARNDVPVTIVEGDGSVLTNLGNINLIGNYYPDNFLHIVLDNSVYASCSGEKTIGSELIPNMASVFGYSKVFSVNSLEKMETILQEANKNQDNGPTMIHLNINQVGERQFKRPLAMTEIAQRFQHHFMQ